MLPNNRSAADDRLMHRKVERGERLAAHVHPVLEGRYPTHQIALSGVVRRMACATNVSSPDRFSYVAEHRNVSVTGHEW